MATSPSTDNYTLGKGVVYFNQLVSAGVYAGERDLGNAPAFAFNISLEKLEHYSSRGGLRAKDKEIISQISPGVSFTLDEINKDNVALLSLGDTVDITQAAGVASAEVVTGNLGMRTDLAYRSIGTHKISHGTVTSGPFTVADEVTSDNVDVGTGIIAAVDTGFIMVAIQSGTFADTDTITDTSGASADMSADPVWTAGVIMIQDSADSVTYVAGTDYVISTTLRDDSIGRFQVLSTGSITEGEVLHVTYGYAASSYSEIRAFKQTQLEGKLRFVSDNPAGTQQELQIWRVSLAPTGDTALIGDDWSTLAFTGEVLKDESNTDSPYMTIIME